MICVYLCFYTALPRDNRSLCASRVQSASSRISPWVAGQGRVAQRRQNIVFYYDNLSAPLIFNQIIALLWPAKQRKRNRVLRKNRMLSRRMARGLKYGLASWMDATRSLHERRISSDTRERQRCIRFLRFACEFARHHGIFSAYRMSQGLRAMRSHIYKGQ